MKYITVFFVSGKKSKASEATPLFVAIGDTIKQIWEHSHGFYCWFATTQGGYDSILEKDDRLTKMTHFIPTKKPITIPEVADLFITHISCVHGLPKFIVLDNDVKFAAHFWTIVFDTLRTKLGMSVGDHLEMDGHELNYGYRSSNPTTTGIPQKVPSSADFVVQMQEMRALCKSKYPSRYG